MNWRAEIGAGTDEVPALFPSARQRQLDPKSAAAAGFCFEADAALHVFDEAARDVQPPARAAFLARRGRIRLRELLEDARAEVLRNSRSLVADVDAHRVLRSFRP